MDFLDTMFGALLFAVLVTVILAGAALLILWVLSHLTTILALGLVGSTLLHYRKRRR